MMGSDRKDGARLFKHFKVIGKICRLYASQQGARGAHVELA